MVKTCFILIVVAFTAISATGQTKHSADSLYPSYKGLVMAGYQGWFRVNKGQIYPDETRVRIDMWPDVSEYEQTYPTGLKLDDGSTARFFNSADKSTIDLHFEWMKDYAWTVFLCSAFLVEHDILNETMCP